MLVIFIDGDGCAVRDETYKVADRYKLEVILVANKPMAVPAGQRVTMKTVPGGFDSADDWIAENIASGDVLITSDLLLAARALKRGARVVGPKGRELNEENIGDALGGRELGEHLRHLGETKTGPSAMTKSDRSKFLATLDTVVHSIKKHGR